MFIILMGPQGSGKGTQAERLLPQFHLESIATGELFRNAVAAGTPLGLRAKELMDRGELVPDDVTIALVEDRLEDQDARRAAGEDVRGALFDGFPRTQAQAEALDHLLARRGGKVDRVILIDVDRDVLVERVAGRRICPNCEAVYHVTHRPPRIEGICDVCGAELEQRPDDVKALERRLDAYYAYTAPIAAFYEQRGILARIDGSKPIDEVTASIQAALGGIRERDASGQPA